MANNETQLRQTLTERIQAHYGQLKNAERKVADYLLKNPDQLLESSITTFSRELGVSEATISRFSKAIGYEGFPSLKLSIASHATRTPALPNIPTELSEDDSIGEMGGKLLSTLTFSIQMTANGVDAEALETAASLLSGANRLIFVGVGGAASICVEAMHLFIKAGRQAEAVSDGYTQVAVATALKEGDVMVGVSHTGQTRSVARALSIATSNGAETIAITSEAKSEVAKSAGNVLTTWNSQTTDMPLFGDFLEGRMSQLFLVDLLYLSTVFKSANAEKDNLLTTGDALKRYYGIA